MSSDRHARRFFLAGLLALAGCGFVPVYQENSDLRGAFVFESDPSVLGYHISARLEERLGRTVVPQYLVKVTADSSERAAAITAEGDTARLNIVGAARWVMFDLSNDRQIDNGQVEAFTSYSATGSTVATQTTRDDARERLATILADMITTQVLARASELPR
ncbi:hypothetical protein [Yoonia litorea]|uniref:LPS-assembly lipoprotein n=1 Tax=Yoonia litorea TaxID=1123755 RepID=A0A1I6MWX8_9RHOB|nr:hypothetical protein [Yoonia litorea]SFS20169.1 LPS-assembly lipoprotein [Yoonia litorea]